MTTLPPRRRVMVTTAEQDVEAFTTPHFVTLRRRTAARGRWSGWRAMPLHVWRELVRGIEQAQAEMKKESEL